MASGHTPSRKHPEYWNGDIPWMNVGDARPFHGRVIHETSETTNPLGIENSAAVVLPEGTVCLSRTGSIGYAVILGRPMATSQGFINWICGPELLPRFLQQIFLAEYSFLHEISEGVAHTTIYFPEAKAFCVCIPGAEQQHDIVAELERQSSRLDEAVGSLKRVRTHLRGFEAAALQEAVDAFPSDKASRLLDACHVISGFAFESEDFCDKGTPVVKIANVGYGQFVWKDQQYLPERFLSRLD